MIFKRLDLAHSRIVLHWVRIKIPISNVTTIEFYAFCGCTSLRDIVFWAKVFKQSKLERSVSVVHCFASRSLQLFQLLWMHLWVPLYWGMSQSRQNQNWRTKRCISSLSLPCQAEHYSSHDNATIWSAAFTQILFWLSLIPWNTSRGQHFIPEFNQQVARLPAHWFQQDCFCLGMTPLHIIASSSRGHSVEVFQCMIGKYPNALVTEDCWSDIPLSIEVIHFLFKTCTVPPYQVLFHSDWDNINYCLEYALI